MARLKFKFKNKLLEFVINGNGKCHGNVAEIVTSDINRT